MVYVMYSSFLVILHIYVYKMFILLIRNLISNIKLLLHSLHKVFVCNRFLVLRKFNIERLIYIKKVKNCNYTYIYIL